MSFFLLRARVVRGARARAGGAGASLHWRNHHPRLRPAITDGVLVVRGGKMSPSARALRRKSPRARKSRTSRQGLMPGLVDSTATSAGERAPTAPRRFSPTCASSIRLTSATRASSARRPAHHDRQRDARLRPPFERADALPEMKDGKVVDDLLIRDARGEIAGGIKMANGTNALRTAGAARFRGRAPNPPRSCASSL